MRPEPMGYWHHDPGKCHHLSVYQECSNEGGTWVPLYVESYVQRLEEAAGEQVQNMKRWKNKAQRETRRKNKLRDELVAMRAERDEAIRLMGMHDPTGEDHLNEMVLHADRADKLLDLFDELEHRLNKAITTLEVMGGRTGSHHPDVKRLMGKREGVGLALSYLEEFKRGM
jgi:hypothetical protein